MSLPKRQRFSVSKSVREPLVVVVVGGGVAGVSCAIELHRASGERLARGLPPLRVVLMSASAVLKHTLCVAKYSELAEELQMSATTVEALQRQYPSIEPVLEAAAGVDLDAREVKYAKGTLKYDALCLCLGAAPKTLAPACVEACPERVLTLRDSQSVEDLVKALRTAKRVAVVGNGGIALELVHTLTFCEVQWVVREQYVGSAFFDASVSAFIWPQLSQRMSVLSAHASEDSSHSMSGRPPVLGCSLGPHWQPGSFECMRSERGSSGRLHVELGQEVVALRLGTDGAWSPLPGWESRCDGVAMRGEEAWPVRLLTSEGRTVDCDVVVCAIGVEPVRMFPVMGGALDTEDGWLCVDCRFRTSRAAVYAAGDCCSVQPSEDRRRSNGATDGGAGEWGKEDWFQMRLWSQASAMGTSAARAISADLEDGLDGRDWPGYASAESASMLNCFPFPLFVHVTRFFGKKVVLLGRFNAQGISTSSAGSIESCVKAVVVNPSRATSDCTLPSGPSADVELHLRITPEVEYVKVVVHGGRVVGALLVGDTGLEETLENLILNRTDVSGLGAALLDPALDLDDYFD